MRYHFVVNGYSDNGINQLREMQGFSNQYFGDQKAGQTMLIKTATDQYCAETVLDELCRRMHPQDIYVFGSDADSVKLCVQAAARAKGTSMTAVHEAAVSDGLIIKKMVYLSRMEATFRMKQGPYCISLARGLERVDIEAGVLEEAEEIVNSELPEHVISSQLMPGQQEKGLEAEQIIIAAGRGINSKENAEVLQQIAQRMGGELGVSRPVAMNAWAPMHKLIGVSGAMVHPDICITAGVSGAAAFYAGIEKSKFIAAINTSAQAPIMKQADVAIIDDFEPVLDELIRLIEGK